VPCLLGRCWAVDAEGRGGRGHAGDPDSSEEEARRRSESVWFFAQASLTKKLGGFYYLPLFTCYLYELPFFTLILLFCHSFLYHSTICPFELFYFLLMI
jgi:hypothetical protein